MGFLDNLATMHVENAVQDYIGCEGVLCKAAVNAALGDENALYHAAFQGGGSTATEQAISLTIFESSLDILEALFS